MNMEIKNDKGFTLIELIVVIAIIAVLAVVLAPQYIQYVERGRESSDIQYAQNLMDAASMSAATLSVIENEYYTIGWDTSTSRGGTADGELAIRIGDDIYSQGTPALVAGNEFYDAFFAIIKEDELYDAISTFGNSEDFKFTITAATGEISISATASPNWALKFSN